MPLLLKKSLEGLRKVSFVFLCILVALILFVMAQLPFFRGYYSASGQLQVEYLFKQPSLQWIIFFYSMILSFYIQPFVLGFRNELLLPSIQRLSKVAFLSVFFEAFIFVFFSGTCYAAFGDQFTESLIFLRKGEGVINYYVEQLFRLCLFFFLVVMSIGIPCYNQQLRQYLQSFSLM